MMICIMRDNALRQSPRLRDKVGGARRPLIVEPLAIVGKILYRAKDLNDIWRARVWPRA